MKSRKHIPCGRMKSLVVVHAVHLLYAGAEIGLHTRPVTALRSHGSGVVLRTTVGGKCSRLNLRGWGRRDTSCGLRRGARSAALNEGLRKRFLVGSVGGH